MNSRLSVFCFRLLVFFPLLIICRVDRIQASIDKISEKLSRNQNQFEEAISNLNFEFSDEAVAKLKSDLLRVNEIIKTRKQIGEAVPHLHSLASSLNSQRTVEKPSFMSVDVSTMRLWNLVPFSEAERTDSEGFTLPSIKEWFLDRQRDWMLLGAEVMNAYDDFFKNNKLSPESFKQLVENSIENLVFRGRFVWFNMEIPRFRVNDFSNSVRNYAKYIKPFKNQTIDKDKYLSELKEQAFYVLWEGKYRHFVELFDYRKFSVRTYYSRSKTNKKGEGEDLRLTRFQKSGNYFPLLEEDHILALFEIESRREAIERSIEELKTLRLKSLADLFEENRNHQSFSFISGNIKPHIPKIPKEKYEILKRIFENCYVKMTFENARALHPSFNLKFFMEDSSIEYNKKSTILPVFASKSYSFDHKDSYCRMIGPVFRYIYLENELELYKKYISESGDFYDHVTELKKKAESLSERLRESKKQLSTLEKNYQEELGKDREFLGIRIPFLGTDSDRLKSLQSQIEEQNNTIKSIENEEAIAIKDLKPYKFYHDSVWRLHVENLRAEKKALSDQLKEVEGYLNVLEEASIAPRVWILSIWPMKGMLSLIEDTKERINSIRREIKEKQDQVDALFRRNSWRWKIANERIRTLENLLPQFQKEYEEAKSKLASFSLEEGYKKIQTEWVNKATDFFEWLEQQHRQQQKYEKATVLKKDLPVFIHKVREQVGRLKSRLTNLKEKNIHASSVRGKYLELKLKIISDLNEKRQPRLEDVFHALLLEHYGKRNPNSYDEFLSILNDNLSETEEPVPVDSFKEIYETKISNIYHKGQPLLYNRRAFSLTQPLLENRVQCYSGSLLFYMLTELSGLTDTSRFALFTKGHVLPGILSDNGDELWGIESTAEGKGLVKFGSVPEISGNIRIVEMYPFLLIELLKSEISNFPDLYAESQKALKKYGFSIENLYPLVQDTSHHVKKNSGSYDVLNKTPFGFGSVNVPPGDRKRGKITEESLDFYDLEGKRDLFFGDLRREGDSSSGGLEESGLLLPPSGLPDFLKQPSEQSQLSEEEKLHISEYLLKVYNSFDEIMSFISEERVCPFLFGLCNRRGNKRGIDIKDYLPSCWNTIEDQVHQLYRKDVIDFPFYSRIMECIDSGHSAYHNEYYTFYLFTFDTIELIFLDGLY